MAVSEDVIFTGGGEAEREAAYADVRLALEQRNLALAAERCGRLLQDYPDDAAAHALMGDIYAARQLWADAEDWYRRAEELGAGPEISRRRVAAQAMRRERAEQPVEPSPYTDLHRQRTRLLAIFGGAVFVVIVAGIIALFAYSSGTRPTPRPPSPTVAAPFVPPAPEPSAPGLAVTRPSPPAATAPGTAAATGARPPAAGVRGQPAAPPPVPRAPVVISRLMTVPATDEDFIIAQAVGALTWPHGASMSGNVSVMMDPYQGYAMITFRIPDDLPGNNLADVVVEQAYKVINAAFAADAGLTMCTVRAIATITGADRRGHTLQAFRANATRESLLEWARLIPNPTAKQIREQMLGTVWWNPSVPTDRLR